MLIEDRVARDNNGVKYPIVRQDLFDRTVNAKGMQTKRFQRNGLCIFDYDYTKNNQPKKIWVDKGTKIADEFEKLCKPEGKQIRSSRNLILLFYGR